MLCSRVNNLKIVLASIARQKESCRLVFSHFCVTTLARSRKPRSSLRGGFRIFDDPDLGGRLSPELHFRPIKTNLGVATR
jgi:hypothetical protein